MYTMEYYSAIKRNEFESALVRWMNLEPFIHCEVNQKVLYDAGSSIQWSVTARGLG